jgi:1-acyl-sn-glycerol-3-phosphate acyltransferase
LAKKCLSFNKTVYDITRIGIWIISKIFFIFDVRITYLEKIPTSGSVILAPSHKSWLDIPLLTLLTKRYIYYVAKKSLFNINKFIEWYFNSTGVIAIDREKKVKRNAINKITKTLKEDKVVAIYPEGTRFKGEGIKELDNGIAYILFKHQIYPPIYPVVITYQKGKLLGLPLKINIILGKKINTADYSNQEDLMSAIHNSLLELFNCLKSPINKE